VIFQGIARAALQKANIDDARDSFIGSCRSFPSVGPITETTTETTVETTEREFNVGNVGTDREKPKRRLRLNPRQEELVEVLEEQFEDTHSRGAFCRIVSDDGLGEEVTARLLRETLE
jgi:hypothetical protein